MASITNSGQIVGGTGGASTNGAVFLSGTVSVSSFVNSGSITDANVFGSVIRLDGTAAFTGGLTNSNLIENTGGGTAVELTQGTSIAGGITNSGQIKSAAASAIWTAGSIDRIDNTGTISGGFGGVINSGSIGTIDNRGTITGSEIGVANYGQGTIGTLRNLQGVGNEAGALTFAGTLPTNYTMLIDITNGSVSHGQLQVFQPAGSTTFGVDSLSTTGLVGGMYQSVLSGVALTSVTNSTGTCAGAFTCQWRLVDAGNDVANLHLLASINPAGPSLASGLGDFSNPAATTLPVFEGGTLRMDVVNGAFAQNFTLASGVTNTIDQFGNRSIFSGVISDATVGQAGGVNIVNTESGGAVIFTGANTYSGGTTIGSGATLQIGNGGASGSLGSGDVVNGGALVFNRSTAMTVANVISGSGSLSQVGTGAIILTGTNTYSGVTTIGSGATLQIGNGGTSGAIGSGDVTIGANGGLTFNRSDAVTFANTISGAGLVHQHGSGSLTLTGTNTFSGGFFMTQGTVVIPTSTSIGTGSLNVANGTVSYADGLTLANNLVIWNAGSVKLQVLTGTATQAGSISELDGPGSIEKTGAGTLVLTGASSYTGTTTVSDGRLVMNGAMPNLTMVVDSGSRLGGSGTLGNVVVSSGGVVAPGNSIGTLTVANFTSNAGSIYEVEANVDGQADKIVATGRATLNGGLVRVLAADGRYRPVTEYSILTATGGVTGTFASVTSNLAFLTPKLVYGANGVDLLLQRNDIRFADVAYTRNQTATANGAQSLGMGNPIFEAILNASAPAARDAYDQFSGEAHASARTLIIENGARVRDAVSLRMQDAFGAVPGGQIAKAPAAAGGSRIVALEGVTAWGQAIGSWGRSGSDGNAAGMTSNDAGFILGADSRIGSNWRVGVLGGYTRARFDVDARMSSGTLDNYYAGLYAGAQFDAFKMHVGAAYSWHELDANRTVNALGIASRMTSSYQSRMSQVFGELSYAVKLPAATVEPFAGLAYVNVDSSSFAETGGVGVLSGKVDSSAVAFSTLGLRVSSTFMLGATEFSARATLGWRHAFDKITPTSTVSFQGGLPFTVAGVPVARDAAVVEGGIDMKVSPNAKLGLYYQGQFGERVQQNRLNARFNLAF